MLMGVTKDSERWRTHAYQSIQVADRLQVAIMMTKTIKKKKKKKRHLQSSTLW